MASTSQSGSVLAGWNRQASLTTALTGANNDLTYTAVAASASGNTITVRYVDPAANSQALGVSVTGSAITVNLATSGAGAITSTAAAVRTAVNGNGPAAALVSVALAAGNDGTGVVTALPATALSGGQSTVVGRSAGATRIVQAPRYLGG